MKQETGFLPFLLALVLISLLTACGSTPKTSAKSPEGQSAGRISAEALRVMLLSFEDRFSAAVAATADDIADKADSREVRELTLRLKLRLIPAVQEAVRTDDPREAFLDIWMICIQTRDLLTTGTGKNAFGPQQPQAVDMIHRLERAIERVGKKFMTAPEFAEANKDIDRLAAGHPIKGKFATDLMRASDRVAADRNPSLFSMLAIPIGGVSESADAIDRLARVVAVFTEVVESMPERTRWNTELLMLSAERLELLRATEKDLDRFSRAVDSIALTAKDLPASVRKELDAAIESTEESQKTLRATLAEARGVVTETNTALERLTTAGDSLKEVATSASQTAEAWKSAVDSVHGVLGDVKTLSEPRPRPKNDERRAFDILEYEQTAKQIDDAAAEIRAMLTDIESGKLSNISAEARTVVNLITVRALMVLGALFALVVSYKLGIARFVRSQ